MDVNNKFSWLVWVLPFLVSGGFAVGSLLGYSLFFGSMIQQEGPEGDLAGAAGALMILICTAMGFIMAMITVIIAKLKRLKKYNHFTLRFGLSIAGGIVIGAIGTNGGGFSTAIAWLLLFCLPIIFSWPWQVRSSSSSL